MVWDQALTRSRPVAQLHASPSDHALTLMSAAKIISSQKRRMVPGQDHMNFQGQLTLANHLRIQPLERLRETGLIYPRTPLHPTNTRISLNTLKPLMPTVFPKLLRVMRNS
jgi:anaerobic glycerol-3-phosphate dehydrogenase